jgi:hypothetical protein
MTKTSFAVEQFAVGYSLGCSDRSDLLDALKMCRDALSAAIEHSEASLAGARGLAGRSSNIPASTQLPGPKPSSPDASDKVLDLPNGTKRALDFANFTLARIGGQLRS